MIMLKEPLQLKSLLGITHNNAFADRIRANYEFMTAVITKEELLHLLLGEPEQIEQRNGITMIVENVAVVNQNEVIIELINQVLNRILRVGETDITYQDNVYIGCVLRKLGIADIHTFLERIQSSKEEYILKNQLLEKYKQERDFFKIYQLTENRKPENQTNIDKTLAEGLEKKEENYLYEKVIQRLCTMETYQAVSQWNYSQGAGHRILFHNELALSEQQENVLNMRLAQEKREYVYPSCRMDFICSNLYEAELPDNTFSGKDNIAVSENNVSVRGDTVSTIREKAFTHLLESALFSLAKSVSLAAVFRGCYGKKDYWFEMGFEICNIVKNTLNRCQWQYQNWQVLNTGDIQKFLEQQKYLYRYELCILRRLTQNKENVKELLIYKENTKDKELRSSLKQNDLSERKLERNYLEQSNLNENSLEQNNLNQNWLEQSSLKEDWLEQNNLNQNWLEQNNFNQNNFKQNEEEKSSLDNKEITLKLKEILNGKNIETIRSAEKWKERVEGFHTADKENYREREKRQVKKERAEKISEEKEQREKWQIEKIQKEKMQEEKIQKEKEQKDIQGRKDKWKKVEAEKENEKFQEKWYTENKKIFFDLYVEIQRIGMAENYLGKYFRISGKKSKEIEEALDVFEKLSVQVNKLIEEMFLKETKNRKQFYQSQPKQVIEYFSENQFEEKSKEKKLNNNAIENSFFQNNIIFPQAIQATESKLWEDKQKKDNIEINTEANTGKITQKRTEKKEQIQNEKIWIEKRTNEKIEKEKWKKEELQRKQIKEKLEKEKFEKENIQREKTETQQTQREKKNKKEDLQIEKLKIKTEKIQNENPKKVKIQTNKSEKDKLQIEKFEKEELQKEKITEEIQDIFKELTTQKKAVYKQKENSTITEQNNLFFNTESSQIEQSAIFKDQNSYELSENQVNIIENPLSVTKNQNLYEISENQKNIIKNQKNTDQLISTLHKTIPSEKEISEKSIKEIQQVFHELNLQGHQTDYKKSTTDIQSLNNSISYVKTQSESAVNQSVLDSQNYFEISEKLTDVVQQKIINQNNIDIHNLNQIKKEIQEQTNEAAKKVLLKNIQGQAVEAAEEIVLKNIQGQAVETAEEIVSKSIQKQTVEATKELVLKSIQKQTVETANQKIEKNVQEQAAETTEKMSEKKLVLKHMPVIETEKEIQKEIQKEVEKDVQKEVIQQIFHEIETEILYETQKNTQNLQRNKNYFYSTKTAEIVYHQITPDILEPVDLNENTKENTNKTITVTEKMFSQNKVKISKLPAADQSQTKTDIKQINEAVQTIQSNIQKHINQITEQVYQKIEKKLQNERRRRGL